MKIQKTSQGIKFIFENQPKNFPLIKEGAIPEEIYVECEVKLDDGIRSLKKVVFKKCVFRKQTFSQITISNCNFNECYFIACTFNDVEFHQCEFKNSLFNKPRFEKTYLDPKTLLFNFSEWKKDASNINTTLYQRLEANLRDTYQEEFAKTAHIQFRRYKRWQEIFKIKTNPHTNKKLRIYWDFLRDLTYESILLYGYGLYRALLLTILTFYAITIGVDHYWSKLGLEANVSNLTLGHPNKLQKLYFLVVTATTLGYGDITPKSEGGMIFVIVLLSFSVVWTATLTALIVKRLVK